MGVGVHDLDLEWSAAQTKHERQSWDGDPGMHAADKLAHAALAREEQRLR